MKKVLFSVIGISMLAGCASYYDYYTGGVKYVQDGDNCIYYAGEMGRHFSYDVRTMDKSKKIVYRNTRCADLYAQDMADQPVFPERKVLTPAAEYVAPAPAVVPAPTCGCKSCGQVQPIVRRKYVIVSAM